MPVMMMLLQWSAALLTDNPRNKAALRLNKKINVGVAI